MALPSLVADVLGASPNDVVLALSADMTVAWVSDSATGVLGWDPSALVGRPALELLHPDELDRALAVVTATTQGYAPRSTARYRIRSAGGDWVECDLSVAAVESDELPGGLAVWVRLAYDQLVLREVLDGLLEDLPTADVLATLLELVFLRNELSRCVITFPSPGASPGRADGPAEVAVGSDLPPELIGRRPVSDPDPWQAAQRGLETLCESSDDLPPGLRDPADDAGLGGLWVRPVFDEHGSRIATLTTWMVRGGPSPTLNTYALGLLAQLVELVLRWRRQVDDLAHAARHDPLTGLANRRVLDEITGDGDRPVAVLSLDLDRFKPVNDRHGHAAGDAALVEVARRLERTVRAEDVVLRVGGDEFVVLCFDTDVTEAEALAARVRAAVAEPMELGAATASIGTSIGIAVATVGTPGLLEQADAALYRAKERVGIARAGLSEG